jgi:hypothetical protein
MANVLSFTLNASQKNNQHRHFFLEYAGQLHIHCIKIRGFRLQKGARAHTHSSKQNATNTTTRPTGCLPLQTLNREPSSDHSNQRRH